MGVALRAQFPSSSFAFNSPVPAVRTVGSMPASAGAESEVAEPPVTGAGHGTHDMEHGPRAHTLRIRTYPARHSAPPGGVPVPSITPWQFRMVSRTRITEHGTRIPTHPATSAQPVKGQDMEHGSRNTGHASVPRSPFGISWRRPHASVFLLRFRTDHGTRITGHGSRATNSG